MNNKVKTILNVFILITLLTIATIFFVPFVSLFSAIPLRMLAILLVPVLFTIIIFSFNRFEKQPLKSLGFQKEYIVTQVLIGILIFVLLSVLFIAIPVIFGVDLKDLLPAKDNLIFALIYRIIFIGFYEELVFRGYLLNRFMSLTHSKIAAVIISSLLFGTWHFIGTGGIITFILTSVIGAILGVSKAYIKNCSVLSVALAHGIYDGLLSLLSWVMML